MSFVIGMWKSGLVITRKQDIYDFLKGLCKGHVDIKDVNNPKYYISISKDKNDKILVGYTRYGNDPITAPPILLRDLTETELINFLWQYRKSINERFFRKEVY